MRIVEEYLENAIDGYPHLILKILIFDVHGMTIVAPLLFDTNNKMLPYDMQHLAKNLLAKVVDDESTYRQNFLR